MRNKGNIKKVKFLTIDWIDYITTKIALKNLHKKIDKEYLKETEEFFQKIKNGQIIEPSEIYEFYEKYNIEPNEIIDKGNGCYTYIYNDGFVFEVNVIAKSLLDDEVQKKLIYS